MNQVNVLFKTEIDALNLNLMYIASLVWIQLGLFHLMYTRQTVWPLAIYKTFYSLHILEQMLCIHCVLASKYPWKEKSCLYGPFFMKHEQNKLLYKSYVKPFVRHLCQLDWWGVYTDSFCSCFMNKVHYCASNWSLCILW